MVGKLATRRGRQMLLATVAKQSAGRTAKGARELSTWQLKMLSISRDHPLVRTEGMAGLRRVEVYKEPGRRNCTLWLQKASRHLGLRISDAPGSRAATLFTLPRPRGRKIFVQDIPVT